MARDKVIDAFEVFGDRLQKNAKDNLRVVGKGGGRLESKMDHFAKKVNDGYSWRFFMEDYWEFIDRGVRGVGGFKNVTDRFGKIQRDTQGKPLRTRWIKKKVTDPKFKYTNKRPPTRVFDRWTVRKGLAPRASGRFRVRGGLKFALAETVFREGIETTNFFLEPFDRGFETLPGEIAEAYIEQQIKDLQDRLDKRPNNNV